MKLIQWLIQGMVKGASENVKKHWVASQASRMPNQVATGQRSSANGMPGVNETRRVV